MRTRLSLNTDSMRRMLLPALIVAIQLASPPAAAQQARLRAEEGPHFVGVPVRLQVTAEGFDETPQPQIKVADPPQGRLELTGVNPSISTSIQIINGRMSQSKWVQFAFEYQYLAQTPGEQVIGPFRITQNGKQASTGKLRLVIGEIPVSSRQRLRLILPQGPLIVGQRVPVRLEWWVPADLRGTLSNPRLAVPLFERLDAFRFHDPEDPTADIALTIDTASGPVELAATTHSELWNGEQYLVHTLTRRLTPLRTGEYELAPASLVVDEAIRWHRNLFGERILTRARKHRVEDEPQTLIVQDLPRAGRPESFTGTVGPGYRLEVAADRSVVQVGDPIRLTLILRGDAAVETAVLPPLTADGGLSPQDFRIPNEKIAGVYTDGAKRFQVTVRALHEGVTAIPLLAFSWYDPERREYQTTHSQPVALSVRPAQVVSAEDVVSAVPEEPHDRTLDPGREPTTNPEAGSKARQRPVFSLTGADLAITTDIDALLEPSGSLLTSVGAQAVAYGLGLLVILLALLARRRAQADPADLARTKALRTHRTAVTEARSITEASAALRRMVATAGIPLPSDLDRFLAECDALAYAPGGASRTLDGPMRARALLLADQLLKEAR
ncbi:BatD family protein [Candidatus Thiosymbion oneisti]|uniref:BatD family protein n=1 Tax=Candidatus Thiosymbion oneisti TaxID=589554 RepID=UPI000B7F13E9|nr:BatD family protein [Candidatus Thiosymbion oneisti]